MSIKIKEIGSANGKLLICLPGMIGGPDDFRQITQGLEDKHRILLVDINPEQHVQGLKNLSSAAVNAVDYKSCSDDLAKYLDANHPNKKANLIGISIGGKIVYHFFADHFDKFSFGFITDITPGKMNHTDLYSTVITTVESLNLNLQWKELKNELASKIEDRNFRVLLKSQLFYPKKTPPARWRNGIEGLRDLLDRNTSDDLWLKLEELKEKLQDTKKLLIFKADKMSGLDDNDLNRLKQLNYVEFVHFSETTHFMHVEKVNEMRSYLETRL